MTKQRTRQVILERNYYQIYQTKIQFRYQQTRFSNWNIYWSVTTWTLLYYFNTVRRNYYWTNKEMETWMLYCYNGYFYALQVVALWTTCVGVCLFLLSFICYTLLYSHICLVSISCSSRGFLIFFSLLPQGHLMYNSWSLDIYSCRYSLVSLCFTN